MNKPLNGPPSVTASSQPPDAARTGFRWIIHNLPLRQKLILVILTVCTLALTVVASVLFWLQTVTFRKSFEADFRSLAYVTALQCSPALAAQDDEVGAEVLSALRATHQVASAAVYKRNGELFTIFGEDNNLKRLSPTTVSSAVLFRDGFATLRVPIKLEEKSIGSLMLRVRYQNYYDELIQDFFKVFAVAALASLLVILVFSNLLQAVISQPVVDLARVATDIIERGNYSLRAHYESQDEIGVLTQTFNQMLDRFQSRDDEVRRINDSLAQKISERKLDEERERHKTELMLRRTALLLNLSQQSGLDYEEQLKATLTAASEFLNVEQVGFWKLSEDGEELVSEQQYFLSRRACQLDRVLLKAKDHANYFKLLRNRQTLIAANDALTDTRLADFVAGHFKPLGITSKLDAPVNHDGRVLGVVCFEHTGPKRTWSNDDTDFAVAIAQHIVLVLETHERQIAEAALIESRKRYEVAVKGSSDGLWDWDLKNNKIYYSPRWKEMIGYADHELANQYGEWEERIHEVDRDQVLEVLTACVHGNRTAFQMEFRFRHKDGSYRWILSRGAVLCDDGGKAIRLAGSHTDITSQKEAAAELDKLHQQTADAQRKAGMAEVATGVLHNVGNVLNSVSVSATIVREQLATSKLQNLVKSTTLLRDNMGNLGTYLTQDTKGRLLPDYLIKVTALIAEEHQRCQDELVNVAQNIEHMKEIVAMQQNYARVSNVVELLPPKQLVEDSIRINVEALTRHGITVIREFSPSPPVAVDKHKVLQILVNLIQNAKHAVKTTRDRKREIRVGVTYNGNGHVNIYVTDNGVGIPSENLSRIFQMGFTTKQDGHGFGLHSGANAARSMGGNLSVHSKGPGEGSTFSLELPVTLEAKQLNLLTK